MPTRPDYIKWLLLAGAAALVVFMGLYVMRHYILPRSVTVDRYRYPVAGLDISNHNGDIDFDAVCADDYQFVFIKASEGKTHKDEPACSEKGWNTRLAKLNAARAALAPAEAAPAK